jgi:putative ABC transport system substrate-binding protein
MQRRVFIAIAAAALAAWPVAGQTQQPSIPTIGFMSARSPEESANVLQAYHKGLKEDGFTDGENVRSTIAGRAVIMGCCRVWQAS